MLPLGHFLVAIVPVVVYVLARDRRFPSAKLVGVVFLGSQFPDLIDKPLAHLLFLIPSGRVFLHSLPVAVPVWIGVLLVAWKANRKRGGGAFVFAYASHLLADSYRALLGPDPRIPSDLLWPFRPPIPRPIEPGWAGPGSIYVKLWTVFSVVVLCVALYFLVREFSGGTTST